MELFRIERRIKDWSDPERLESCKPKKVNPLTYLTYVLASARNKSITLPTPDEFTASNIAHVG